MRLYEHQAKAILSSHHIPVPPGRVVETAEGAERAWLDLGGEVMIKAQVLSGGRGKAGAVRRVSTAQEARGVAAELLGISVAGLPVRKLLVEAAVSIAQECYVAILTDATQAAPLVMLSSAGGIEIESLAREHPGSLVRMTIDVLDGLRPYHSRWLLSRAQFPPAAREDMVTLLATLYRIYCEYDARLLEINPLAITEQGELVALDARMIVDDNALARQPRLREWRELNPAEREAERARINYVSLPDAPADEGRPRIGIIGTGAGMAMANMDQVAYFGGQPANFMDVGPGMMTGGARTAMEILLRRNDLDAILVSGYSAGPLEIMARDVVEALAAHPEKRLPVVVRLQGHHDVEARAVLENCTDARLHLADDFDEAARRVVALAGQQEVPT
ncbi:MAG: succinate--CoA ligase subunit beta [Caldilineae bacterium]|nr:MAG: succinate--CoA ligase subunit beta [Caldilineae bacterium]